MDKNERNPIRILLVDDDSFVHEMVGSMINEEEYSLISAMNVSDAMRVIMNQRPDVIVTDAMMPGESGFCLISRVKSDPRTQDIPIILLTILQEPNGSPMDATGKADFCVSKPIYLSNLASTLERATQLVKDRSEIEFQLPEAPDIVTVVL